jgi:phosphoribosylaminoimidazole (AIR) synthetase
MGAGFAVYVPEKDVATVLDVAKAFPFGALCAGHVENSAAKRVVITPKDLAYSADTLAVR